MSTGSIGVVNEGLNAVIAEFFTAIEEAELDEEGNGDEVGLESVKELNRGGSGAAGGEEVVDEQDLFPGMDGVFMDFHDIFAVFQGVRELTSIPWELALFPDGDKSSTEAIRDGGGENKATSVDAYNFVDFCSSGGLAK